MKFWGNTREEHFFSHQTGPEDTRPSSKPVQIKYVVWRTCTTRCCFFRDGGEKPFLPFLSYFCIVKQFLHFILNSYNWGTKASSYYRSKTKINNNYQQWLVNMTIIQQSHCLPVNCRHQRIEAWQLFSSLNTASLLRTRGESSLQLLQLSSMQAATSHAGMGQKTMSLNKLKSIQRS